MKNFVRVSRVTMVFQIAIETIISPIGSKTLSTLSTLAKVVKFGQYEAIYFQRFFKNSKNLRFFA